MWPSQRQVREKKIPPSPRPFFCRGELSEPFENVGLPIKSNRTRVVPQSKFSIVINRPAGPRCFEGQGRDQAPGYSTSALHLHVTRFNGVIRPRNRKEMSAFSSSASSSSGNAAHLHQRTRPPYLDIATGMRYDTSNGSYEGWLTKQSEWLKEWRRRWFILKGGGASANADSLRSVAVCPSLTPFVFCWRLGDKLFFSKSQFSVPHGMIDLSLCQVTPRAPRRHRYLLLLFTAFPLSTRHHLSPPRVRRSKVPNTRRAKNTRWRCVHDVYIACPWCRGLYAVLTSLLPPPVTVVGSSCC